MTIKDRVYTGIYDMNHDTASQCREYTRDFW